MRGRPGILGPRRAHSSRSGRVEAAPWQGDPHAWQNDMMTDEAANGSSFPCGCFFLALSVAMTGCRKAETRTLPSKTGPDDAALMGEVHEAGHDGRAFEAGVDGTVPDTWRITPVLFERRITSSEMDDGKLDVRTHVEPKLRVHKGSVLVSESKVFDCSRAPYEQPALGICRSFRSCASEPPQGDEIARLACMGPNVVFSLVRQGDAIGVQLVGDAAVPRAGVTRVAIPSVDAVEVLPAVREVKTEWVDR